MTRLARLGATLAAAALLLTGCSGGAGDPLGTAQPSAGGAGSAGGTGTVKVGSADFPEAEIIAELYAQALEAKGTKVTRTMQIGARDVYIKALQDGSVDLVPEYTGNLLQYFDKASKATKPEDVNKALAEKTPQEFEVLTPSAAEDKDSYNVTKEFSEKNNIRSLADLKGYSGTLRVGGGAELAERPYGPKGLVSVYGVDQAKVTFVPLAGGGGPVMVNALKNGDVDLANIYTTTPAIAENGFVTLTDPQNMILPQSVVPLIADRVNNPQVTQTLNAVSAKLTTDDLLAMNGRNMGGEKAAPKAIAADWLKEKGLAG